MLVSGRVPDVDASQLLPVIESLDKALDDLDATVDPDKRKALMQTLEKALSDEVPVDADPPLTVLPAWAFASVHGRSSRLEYPHRGTD